MDNISHTRCLFGAFFWTFTGFGINWFAYFVGAFAAAHFEFVDYEF